MSRSSEDPQLDEWQSLWQSTGDHRTRNRSLRQELARRVARESGALRKAIIVEIALTILVFALVYAGTANAPASVLNRVVWPLAFGHAAVVWAGVLLLRRGTWRPFDESTAAFLALVRQRARRTRAGAIFGFAILTLEVAAVWLFARYSPEASAATTRFALLMSAVALLLTPMLVGMLRRASSDRAWLASVGDGGVPEDDAEALAP